MVGVGHALAGHAPDKTYNDPAKAGEMAQDTYSRLVAAMQRINGSGKVIPWDKIKKYVDQFNAARDPKRKAEILEDLATFIAKGGA